MAFPATYDFDYYKGDTFEFRIYPKKNDGTVFDLSQFYVPTNFANTPDDVTDSSAPYVHLHHQYDVLLEFQMIIHLFSVRLDLQTQQL